MKLHPLLVSALVLVVFPVRADLKPVVQMTGRVTLSVDAEGNNNAGGGQLRVNKPVGSTVQAAYLMAATHSVNQRSVLNNGDIRLAGVPVNWNRTEFNNAGNDLTFFHNAFADVTSIVRPILDAASPGITLLTVTETNTIDVDGTILVVVFDDPSLTSNRSIILLFGGQNTSGDQWSVRLAAPVPNDPNFSAIMGLGISFGCQPDFQCASLQQSYIDVNDFRLTTSAGGQDDGASFNGALITVGGIGDSITNPPPFVSNTGFRTDDELYDLRPFLRVGDTSIRVNTLNPSDDDNILFAYFEFSNPAGILPFVTPPSNTRLLLGTLDPALPTIVLTHGLQPLGTSIQELWTGDGSQQAVTLIRNSLAGKPANIVQYVWQEGFQPHCPLLGFNTSIPSQSGYITAYQNAGDAGRRLAHELIRGLGSDYNKPIHFVGHSLGSVVNTHAAFAFLNEALSVTEAQFTALDAPNRIPNGSCLGLPMSDPVHGVSPNFFASNLPVGRAGLTLFLDNYYSPNPTGAGASMNGPFVNRRLDDPNDVGDILFQTESFFGIDNNHSGVQQWYRWTMSPTDPVPSTSGVCNGNQFAITWRLLHPLISAGLVPCERGWHWSLLKNKNSFPGADGNPLQVSAPVVLPLTQSSTFGCIFLASANLTRITCSESSSPFFQAQVNIPSDADYLSFDFKFTSSGDRDFAAILLDDMPIWILSEASAPTGKVLRSGAIPVSGLRGNRTLTVALYGVNQPNFSFEIENFTTSSVTVLNPAPLIATLAPASTLVGSSNLTLTVTGSGFLNGAVIQWNGSPRTTQFVSSTQLTADIPSLDFANAGIVSVTAVNPSPTVGPSAAGTFTVNNPVPALASLSATSALAASGATTLTVIGSGFVSGSAGSAVRWNGAARPTTFVSGTQLMVSIPAADLTAAGAAQVTVLNPGPGGGTSAALTFSVMDFALAASPNAATVRAGQSASYTLTVNPQGGVPFSNPVSSFQCAGLPSLASCSFSPATVTPSANSATVTLTVTTTAASLAPPTPKWLPPARTFPLFVLWLLVAMAFASVFLDSQKRKMQMYWRSAALVLIIGLQISCGGGSASPPPPPTTRPGTPAGNSTIAVTATSGSLQHSVNVTLTVQ